MNLACPLIRHLLPGLVPFLLVLPGSAGHQARAAALPDVAPGDSVPTPRWPLDLPARWLTSNFMEYRDGRYHAGVDFKTREREGFPVYAVESGWIERVRATPGGYGRALYLRGDSGRTYVYAHLARFDDVVEQLVAAEQARSAQYRVELAPPAGALRVKRGRAVGLSGQSGTSGPHLHFEVRDADNRPLDPLATGFAVRDSIAPVIHQVRALAASAQARLAGGASSARLPLPGGATGRDIPLRVSGPVAFSARVVDAADPAGHRLEPWRLELRLDGEVVCRRDNETFDFTENAQQRLEWLELGPVREQWLHRDPAVTVPGREGGRWYLGRDGNGLVPGRHRLELRAFDRAGNRADAAWDLEVLPPGDDPGRAAGGWVAEDVHISLDDKRFGTIVLAPLFEVMPELAAPQVRSFVPGDGQPLLASVRVAALPGAGLDSAQVAQAGRQGLAPQGNTVSWAAAAWPVAGDLIVELPAGTLPAGDVGADVLLCRWAEGRWQRAGPPLAPETGRGAYRFALGRPGTYAALADTVPPVIASAPVQAGPHPGYGPAVANLTPPRWDVFAVPVQDAGAGVDPASLRASWDGQPLVVEPDLPRARILVRIPDDAGAGLHRLDLEVGDLAGQRATATIPVTCGTVR